VIDADKAKAKAEKDAKKAKHEGEKEGARSKPGFVFLAFAIEAPARAGAFYGGFQICRAAARRQAMSRRGVVRPGGKRRPTKSL